MSLLLLVIALVCFILAAFVLQFAAEMLDFGPGPHQKRLNAGRKPKAKRAK